jgi:hypothetical protein
MNSHMSPRTFWSTASFGDAADTSPGELSELGQHMQQCSRPRNNWFVLRCGVDAVHEGLLARFVTSLALLVALVGATVLVI